MKTYQTPAIETTRYAVAETKSTIGMGPENLTRAHPAGSVGFAL